ncbi:capping protein inhibiting regulator of actin dynamics-like [Teleopsis dalmanni]|uniref:capping protein inhibiting regulator of actin dynamics-like n=1 Tax=Teleopsis dalmanni TaxID=139649 RepID=UPI0018CDDCEF|nr:capping protein inhibiting regulator of actin dynamics-like [Teleopsis dalmanni]
MAFVKLFIVLLLIAVISLGEGAKLDKKGQEAFRRQHRKNLVHDNNLEADADVPPKLVQSWQRFHAQNYKDDADSFDIDSVGSGNTGDYYEAEDDIPQGLLKKWARFHAHNKADGDDEFETPKSTASDISPELLQSWVRFNAEHDSNEGEPISVTFEPVGVTPLDSDAEVVANTAVTHIPAKCFVDTKGQLKRKCDAAIARYNKLRKNRKIQRNQRVEVDDDDGDDADYGRHDDDEDDTAHLDVADVAHLSASHSNVVKPSRLQRTSPVNGKALRGSRVQRRRNQMLRRRRQQAQKRRQQTVNQNRNRRRRIQQQKRKQQIRRRRQKQKRRRQQQKRRRMQKRRQQIRRKQWQIRRRNGVNSSAFAAALN